MYNSSDLNDTIIALATPPGVGAIGVIRLSGKEAISKVNHFFPAKDLEKEATHTAHFGTIRNKKNEVLDEVLVTIFKTPKSYTKENIVEISCHGSAYIHQKIIELFNQNGVRLANPGEFTLRAFLNGQMDLSQAEAVADLIASSSASNHELALKQMRGGFSNEIQQLRQELIDFASLLELELDFSEEDVEFANRDKLKALINKILLLLKNLIDSFHLGNVIKNGVNTVIAGRPNAGKSTLLNAMLNEERAIVSEIAGTTRDTIEEVLNIEGIEFRLIDTAGIRDAQDQIEAVGVTKTMEKIEQSAILIYVFDVSGLSVKEVQADVQQLTGDKLQVLVVANKMDLNPHLKIEDFYLGNISQQNFISTSAINKMNIPLLKEKLHEMVLHNKINMDNTIVSNARHHEALFNSKTSLEAALNNLEQNISSDFVALDIRQALHHLGTITGEISTDDLLGNIFGKFCIGK